MRILLLGGGGREHAMAWKIRQSPICSALFIAPGNAGTARCGSNIDLDILDCHQVGAFARNEKIDMLVIGPEAPLVSGIADHFRDNDALKHIHVMGPAAEGAMLEGSKDFAKTFMKKHGIPTARYRSFNSKEIREACAFVEHGKPPFVLKADGLAAGKGVVITESRKEAQSVLNDMLAGKLFGNAAKTVLIEDFLEGEEISVFVATDGSSYCMLPSAKDYKRVGENDTGANTGGMGAVSPVPFADNELMQRIEDEVILPTINGLRTDGIPYCGFLFFGLMIVKGNPYVIEYNVRLGDPETEVIIPRMRTDLVELMRDCCTGKLASHQVDITHQAAITVVLCSGGYPGTYKKNHPIRVPEPINDIQLFFAGMKESEQQLLTDGGRVMAVTALADNIHSAAHSAYKVVEQIDYCDKYYRRDIGKNL